MKLNALKHPKTLHLCALLDVTRPTAIGHLELLWAFTGEMAAQGNIGKWPDGAIARACEWMGAPESFLQSLLQSGFIDQHAEHRYVIHDWSDHAPRWVRAKLAKARLSFIASTARTVEPTTDETDEDDEDTTEGTAEASSKRSTRTSEVKRSTSQGREDDPPGERNGNPDEIARLQAGMKACGALSIELRKLGVNVTSTHPLLDAWVRDFTMQQCIQAVAVCRASLGEDATIAAKYLDKVLRNPPKASIASPPKAADSRRRLSPIEIIERAILDGRTDDEIVAMPELELVPTVREDIHLMRQEIASAQQ